MKTKNMTKRFISVFLSLMMCVSLLQVPAFAAETNTDTLNPEQGLVLEQEEALKNAQASQDVTDTQQSTPVAGDANGNDGEDLGDVNGNDGEDLGDANDSEEEDLDDANDNEEEDLGDANDSEEEDLGDANDNEEEDLGDANDSEEEDLDDANDNEEEDLDDVNDNNEDNANTPESNGDVIAPPSDNNGLIVPDAGIMMAVEEPVAAATITTFEALKNAIRSVKSGQTETIDLKDYDDTEVGNETITVQEGANIVLNLCGKTILGKNINGGDGNLFQVNGTLTINNDDTKGEGTIEGVNVDNVISVGTNGTLNINGGKITAENANRGIFSKGNITMKGGTITDIESKAINGGTEPTWKNALGGGVRIEGGLMTIDGGTISNNKADLGGGIFVNKNGNLTVKGGTIEGNSAVNGGGVYVNNGNLTVKGGTIDGNSAKNGGGVYVKGGTFTMEEGDSGKAGTISNNTVSGYRDTTTSTADEFDSSGGGVYVNGGDFTMNDGTISGNVAKDSSSEDAASYLNGNRGGGVYVAKGDDDLKGTFTLNGGTIENNKAGEGGGVFVEYAAKGEWNSAQANRFFMYGGTVDNNDAYVGEGGGIYIRGIGEITKGYITNNRTHTVNDLGGGGIYVESDGVLRIINAAIFENAAKGLGGGLAACVHGFTSAVHLDGAAIFGNKSEGAEGAVTTSEKIDGSSLWKDASDFKGAAQDIFTASNKGEDGKDAGAVIGNMMVGGGQSNWTGWNVTKNQNGEPQYTWTPVDSKNNAYVESDRLLALTSNASEDAKDAAKAKAEADGVIISGNKSLYTHGGGIANNGVLTFGEMGDTNQFQQLPTLTVEKTVKGDGLDNWEFSFGLKGDNDSSIDEGTATSSNSRVTLEFDLDNFDVSNFGDSNTFEYTFYVAEIDSKLEGVTYDKSQYKITVTVERKVVTNDVNATNEYEFTSYSFSDLVIVKTHDAEGNEITGSNNAVSDSTMNFVNKYTKPVEQTVSNPLEFSLEKVFQAVGEVTGSVSGTFNFEVSVGDKVLTNKAVTVALGKTDSVKFSLDPEALVKNGLAENGKNLVFNVREVNDGQSNVTYSSAVYQVSVPVVVETVTKTIIQAADGTIKDADKDEDGSFLANVTTYSFEQKEMEVTAIGETEDEGFVEADNTFKFVNKYEETKEDPEPKTEEIFVSPDLTMSLGKIFEITGEFAATGTFDFEVYTEENGTKTSLTDDVKINISDLLADPNHTQNVDFSFDFIGDKKFDGNSFTFYVSEKKGNVDGVTYSDNKYQVTVPVTSDVTEIVTDILTTITTTYKYGDATVKVAAGTDANGNTIWGDVTNNEISFTNVFKPTDTDSENPPETPENPPSTPDRPSRPTPTPTPEEPTIEIPEPDVPLAPAPEEPQVSIPDEDVPLAGEPPLVELPEPEVPLAPLAPMPPETTTTIPDPEVPLAGVPQTGDGSGAWFALMALAACGLVVLNLRKKENEI